jgi:hypothetical protein
MVASLGMWALIPLVPFLPLSGPQRLASAGLILVVAEVFFWLGALMAGPAAARRMRSWWRTRSPAEVEHVEADVASPPEVSQTKSGDVLSVFPLRWARRNFRAER